MSLTNTSKFKQQYLDFLDKMDIHESYKNKWKKYLNSNIIQLLKQNPTLTQLCLLKPKIIDSNIIKQLYDDYHTSPKKDVIYHFFYNLNKSTAILEFLLEYSYQYNENEIIKYYNNKSRYHINNVDFYEYVLLNIPFSKEDILYQTFKISQLSHDIFNRQYNSSSKYRHHYNNRNNIHYYKHYHPKNNSKNTRTQTNNINKNRSNNKTKKINNNTKNTKRRQLEIPSYYTKKYRDLVNSYPPNQTFSKCQSVAPDSYRKYRCNFFYNKCPEEGWEKDRVGNIPKCNCSGSSYKYYNNIFDCNPNLGLISSGGDDENQSCDDVNTQEEFGRCFNQTYNKINDLHQKNKEYYETMVKISNEREISKLNTNIIVNESVIKKLATEIKEKFPNQDINNYIYFADFIQGYLMDPLNFIEMSESKPESSDK